MYSASRVPTTHLDTCRVDPLTNCDDATGGRVLKLMGHSKAETTLRNARHAVKRRSAARLPRASRSRRN